MNKWITYACGFIIRKRSWGDVGTRRTIIRRPSVDPIPIEAKDRIDAASDRSFPELMSLNTNEFVRPTAGKLNWVCWDFKWAAWSGAIMASICGGMGAVIVGFETAKGSSGAVGSPPLVLSEFKWVNHLECVFFRTQPLATKKLFTSNRSHAVKLKGSSHRSLLWHIIITRSSIIASSIRGPVAAVCRIWSGTQSRRRSRYNCKLPWGVQILAYSTHRHLFNYCTVQLIFSTINDYKLLHHSNCNRNTNIVYIVKSLE